MAQITAASVQSLRAKTGLPMMNCKRALTETDGDEAMAIEWLRKNGVKFDEQKGGRTTSMGRVAIYNDFAARQAAIIDLRCESAPVAGNEDFLQLAADIVKQLATGPGAKTVEELLAQPSPSKPGMTLRQQFEDLNNRIREVFKLERFERIDATCGAYAHHNGASAVLLQVEGGTPELAKDICMHIAAMRPAALNKEDLDPAKVEKEREILAAAARAEGKPENIITKMVEGRLRNYYAECCLAEQPFVKDDSKTCGQFAQEGGMKMVRFIHWELPKE